MTHSRLISTIAAATGESFRTLARFGFRKKASRNKPEGDPLAVIDCPCCGGTVVLAWDRSDDLPEFADCQRCETVFPYADDEVYGAGLLDVVGSEPRTYAPAT